MAYVKLFEQPKTIRLWLEWIEANPTPDGVLIRDPETGFKRQIVFTSVYMEENALLAEMSVLYRYVHAIEPGTDEWAELKREAINGNAVATLTSGGKPVSNSVPLRIWTWENERNNE